MHDREGPVHSQSQTKHSGDTMQPRPRLPAAARTLFLLTALAARAHAVNKTCAEGHLGITTQDARELDVKQVNEQVFTLEISEHDVCSEAKPVGLKVVVCESKRAPNIYVMDTEHCLVVRGDTLESPALVYITVFCALNNGSDSSQVPKLESRLSSLVQRKQQQRQGVSPQALAPAGSFAPPYSRLEDSLRKPVTQITYIPSRTNDFIISSALSTSDVKFRPNQQILFQPPKLPIVNQPFKYEPYSSQHNLINFPGSIRELPSSFSYPQSKHLEVYSFNNAPPLYWPPGKSHIVGRTLNEKLYDVDPALRWSETRAIYPTSRLGQHPSTRTYCVNSRNSEHDLNVPDNLTPHQNSYKELDYLPQEQSQQILQQKEVLPHTYVAQDERLYNLPQGADDLGAFKNIIDKFVVKKAAEAANAEKEPVSNNRYSEIPSHSKPVPLEWTDISSPVQSRHAHITPKPSVLLQQTQPEKNCPPIQKSRFSYAEHPQHLAQLSHQYIVNNKPRADFGSVNSAVGSQISKVTTDKPMNVQRDPCSECIAVNSVNGRIRNTFSHLSSLSEMSPLPSPHHSPPAAQSRYNDNLVDAAVTDHTTQNIVPCIKKSNGVSLRNRNGGIEPDSVPSTPPWSFLSKLSMLHPKLLNATHVIRMN